MNPFLHVLLISGLLHSSQPAEKPVEATLVAAQLDAAANPASQQDAPEQQEITRAAQWNKKRLEKQGQVVPFQPGKMERRLVEFEKKGFGESLGLRFGDVYVSQGGITTGAGFVGGTVRYFRPNLFESPIDISASAGYSLKRYQLYTFQMGNILRKSPEFFLRYPGSGGLSLFEKTRETEGDFYYYAEIVHRYFPQEDFFGLGSDSVEENKTDYLVEGTSYEGVAAARFSPFVGAFLKAGFFQPNVDRGTDDGVPATHELFDDQTAPGLIEQPDFFRFATTLFFDYRDVFGNPSQGGLYTVSFARLFDRDEGEFNFHRLSFDLRQYVPLGSEQRILALRFYSSFDNAAGNARVPFYLMQTLGGSDSIRGYPDFRFRDENLFFISTEYRWVAHPLWEMVFFYDTGKVFPEFSAFDFNDLKKGYGFGLRLKSNEDVLLRFDVGRSEEGIHLYFKMNASF